jgi:hypothetical protein
MAEKDLEQDDPYEFVAVRYPVEAGVDADAEMARCFVEARGAEFVDSVIDGVFGCGPGMEVP